MKIVKTPGSLAVGGPEIAIIGIGCRFPGDVKTPGDYWNLLCAEREAIEPIPRSRFDAQALFSPEHRTRGATIQQEGGYLRDVDRFDAPFFQLAPRVVADMDPQQRLALELAWEAIEDAGLKRDQLAGSRTGVFLGIWTSDYEGRMFRSVPHIRFHATIGSGRYGAAGRVSFAFDLRGPSFVLDTACSSSLVAVHQACQSLIMGESEMALAGGVNLNPLALHQPRLFLHWFAVAHIALPLRRRRR